VQPVLFDTSIVTDRPELRAVKAVESIACPAGVPSGIEKYEPPQTEFAVVVM
jgi:hypothetical protein